MNSLLAKFFKSLCQGQILLYLTSNYEFSDLRLLSYFVVVLSQIAKGGDCQDICGYCQRHMLCKLANPLTKRTLLVIWQIYDGFITLRNKSSSLVLKLYKSVQETSEEVLFIKTRQIAQQMYLSRFFYSNLNKQLDKCIY